METNYEVETTYPVGTVVVLGWAPDASGRFTTSVLADVTALPDDTGRHEVAVDGMLFRVAPCEILGA